MNFLAHLYLTKDLEEEIIIGNFIADAVKGKKAYRDYPKKVRIGMDIHREIDDFSDRHELFRQGAKRLYPIYGKYSTIIMDIYYDHILASEWDKYHHAPLNNFAFAQYEIIEKHKILLPEFTAYWFHVMKNDNLLYAYSEMKGIEDVFGRMDKRTGGRSSMSAAVKELQLYKEELISEFEVLFTDLQENLRARFGDVFIHE